MVRPKKDPKPVIIRRPPGRPIQGRFPVEMIWAGPGPCPRPPETETAAWARGLVAISCPRGKRESAPTDVSEDPLRRFGAPSDPEET